MIKAKRLVCVSMSTPDLERQIAYYTEIVGLHVVDKCATRAIMATNSGQIAVVLVHGQRESCDRLAFEVSPTLSCADMTRHLNGLGIESKSESWPIPAVEKSLTFLDPKGTAIDLFAAPALAVRGKDVGSTAALKLGHIAFAVPDPLAMSEFYKDTLGFRVSDWIGDYFVFLRCGVDHHSVNFIKGPTSKMHHVAFEMRNATHLYDHCDLLGQKKIEIVWGPMRHAAGHNLATYHFNPDNQIVELFTELDTMSDEEGGFFDPRPWHAELPQRPKTWDPQHEPLTWGLRPAQKFAVFAR